MESKNRQRLRLLGGFFARSLQEGRNDAARLGAWRSRMPIALTSSPGASVGKKRSLKDAWALVKSAVSAWLDDDAPSMGAALSYYTVFSLAPLLLIVIGIAGLMFGTDAVRGEVFTQLSGLMGDEAARAVEGMLAGVSKPSQGIAGSLIGGAVLLVGATTVFGELQNALDRIWQVPARQKSGGLWRLLRTRLLSFGMILGIAFLLMVSLVLGAVIAALGTWWGGAFGSWEVLAQIVNTLIGFVLTTSVFAMIYKLMPRVKVRWHDVLLGAVVTALLFTVGKFLIGLYIGKSAVASSFGAAGSLVVVFVWVYYSAQIFLMGAEFTWVYARTFGSMREQPERSDGAAVSSPPLAAPAVPAAPTARTSGPKRRPLADFALGIAAMLALRYVVPRILRRM
jgi:membrane protein